MHHVLAVSMTAVNGAKHHTSICTLKRDIRDTIHRGVLCRAIISQHRLYIHSHCLLGRVRESVCVCVFRERAKDREKDRERGRMSRV